MTIRSEGRRPRGYTIGDTLTTYIKKGARVRIEALGLDGSTIPHVMRQATEAFFVQEQPDGEVLALVQNLDGEQALDRTPWRVLVSPEDLYDPDVWDGELDRSMVVLDIVSESSSAGPSGRQALLGALRTLIELDASPEALMDAWRRAGADCESVTARCVRMAYEAAQAIDKDDPEIEIADRMLTLAGPRRKRR